MRRRRYITTELTTFDILFEEVDIMEEQEIIHSVTISEYITEIDLLLKQFDYIHPLAYPNDSKYDFNVSRKKVEDGSWNNLGGLLETAIQVEGGLKRLNAMGKDYVDASDAKLITVRISSNGTSYSAPVCNIKCKKGYLRVLCYERKLDRWYFFLIPYEAYKHISKTSNIEIPFNLDGTPRRINKCDVNWWLFEKDTFKDICVSVTPIQVNTSLPVLDLTLSTKNHSNSKSTIPCIEWNGQQQNLNLVETQPTCLSD
jgi:hypothetical protein